jgi:hypothetical protein
MPNSNNNTAVKPIMVGNITLSQLEQCYDSARCDPPSEAQATLTDLLDSFEAVCNRLRLEVKRHKATKVKLKAASDSASVGWCAR